MLRRILEPGREEVTEGSRNLYSSPNIIRVMKSKRVRARYVVRTGEMRKEYRMLIGNAVRKN